ncbi:peptidyl-tRNA hydrolase [compost metagenome]
MFEEWYVNQQPKVILGGKEKDLLKLIEEGFYFIRDNGRTEIPPNSLTVVGLPPMTRAEAKPFVKRLQLLKE